MRPARIPCALALAWGLNWPAVKVVRGAVTTRTVPMMSAALARVVLGGRPGRRGRMIGRPGLALPEK